jgi:Cof subfamily protein (haloacid dehalogenase superfamily)
MIKMIISDLDGTLMTETNEVLPKDKDALQKAIHDSVQLTIASGRMDNEIVEILNVIGRKGHRISQNGAFVYSIAGERLLEFLFDDHLAKEIYEFLPKNDESIVTIFAENQAYAKEPTAYLKKLTGRLFFPINLEPNLLNKMGSEIETSKITIAGETDYLINLEKKVLEKYGEVADTFISDPHCLDIMPKGISKGRSVRALMEKLNIKPDEFACIGDSYNDLSMFDLTPHSYVMSHADDRVKMRANYEVNHVHEMIEHLFSQGLLK